MNISEITPLILTYNEEANIGRCLDRLKWAERVVVIDSGSTDRTLEICEEFFNVKVVKRKFDNHTNQWNFGIELITTCWLLTLDADYVLSSTAPAEFKKLQGSDETAAYYARFRYCIFGRPLKGSLYPPRAVLFRKAFCKYVADGHTQLLSIDGDVGNLKCSIDHDDRKSLSRWMDSQRKYAVLEAEKLLRKSEVEGIADRLRKQIWPAAPAAFIYTLFVKGLILDGWPGLFYSLQRTYAELLLSLEMIDHKLRNRW